MNKSQPEPLTPKQNFITVLVVVALIVVIGLLVQRSNARADDAAHEDAAAVARVLNATGADFTHVTGERDGSVAIETTLYPKDENEGYASLICGPVITAKRNGDLPTIKSARVRASDGSTLAYCDLP